MGGEHLIKLLQMKPKTSSCCDSRRIVKNSIIEIIKWQAETIQSQYNWHTVRYFVTVKENDFFSEDRLDISTVLLIYRAQQVATPSVVRVTMGW